MIIERLLIAFFVATLGMVLFFPLHTPRPPKPAAIVRPPDAPALLKRLDTLDGRMHEAQTSIDQVLSKLSNAHEEAERDVTRVRLGVLYRLEEGLAHDIAKTRDQLAAFSNR
jgi:hypothetical protein